MALISIILSCYNGERYLKEAIQSILNQSYSDWELIFVNDGSKDKSLEIAISYSNNSDKIKIISQQNQGLNAARNFGAKHISKNSEALLFFDADDIMDENMISSLYREFKNVENVGAVYCNFKNINSEGIIIEKSLKNKRIVPTNYWFKKLVDIEKVTPFFSVYSWTLMVEPFTLIKKNLFFKYGGWDEINFPKGDTYGESIPLFGQIALYHKIIFVNQELYLYRKHSNQITSGNFNMKYIQAKIDAIMLQNNYSNPETRKRVEYCIKINKYRLPLYNYINGSMKHELRYKPFLALKNLTLYSSQYIYSLLF